VRSYGSQTQNTQDIRFKIPDLPASPSCGLMTLQRAPVQVSDHSESIQDSDMHQTREVYGTGAALLART
jgi:hypothetical protein